MPMNKEALIVIMPVLGLILIALGALLYRADRLGAMGTRGIFTMILGAAVVVSGVLPMSTSSFHLHPSVETIKQHPTSFRDYVTNNAGKFDTKARAALTVIYAERAATGSPQDAEVLRKLEAATQAELSARAEGAKALNAMKDQKQP
jgi:hypothetical protein